MGSASAVFLAVRDRSVEMTVVVGHAVPVLAHLSVSKEGVSACRIVKIRTVGTTVVVPRVENVPTLTSVWTVNVHAYRNAMESPVAMMAAVGHAEPASKTKIAWRVYARACLTAQRNPAVMMAAAGHVGPVLAATAKTHRFAMTTDNALKSVVPAVPLVSNVARMGVEAHAARVVRRMFARQGNVYVLRNATVRRVARMDAEVCAESVDLTRFVIKASVRTHVRQTAQAKAVVRTVVEGAAAPALARSIAMRVSVPAPHNVKARPVAPTAAVESVVPVLERMPA